MPRFKDRHLKQKLNHKKEFEITITITDNQLKGLEYVMRKSPFNDAKSVEDVILDFVKAVERKYDAATGEN